MRVKGERFLPASGLLKYSSREGRYLEPGSARGVSMSSFDETLFGRIALLNNYLRPDQLEECLAIQRSESPPRKIGDILREKGYLTEEQLRLILDIRRKKLRRARKDPEEAKSVDKTFGSLALAKSYVRLDDLEDAILEQQRLSSLGLHFRLGEILVSRGKLQVSQVLELLAMQEKRILRCPICDLNVNVQRFEGNKAYHCKQCGGRLIEPVFLDTVAVDAVLEGP